MHVFVIFLAPFALIYAIIASLFFAGIRGLFGTSMIAIGLLELLICRIYKKRKQVNIHAGFPIIAWISFVSGIVYVGLLVGNFIWVVDKIMEAFS